MNKRRISAFSRLLILLLYLILTVPMSSFAGRIREMTSHLVVWELDSDGNLIGIMRRPGFIPPKMIRSKPPTYPSSAKKEGISGEVLVAVGFDELGRINEAKLCSSSGNELLDKAALKIAGEMKFEPEKAAGLAITSASGYVVSFVDRGNDATDDRFVVELTQDTLCTIVSPPRLINPPGLVDRRDSSGICDTAAVIVSMAINREGAIESVKTIASSGIGFIDSIANDVANKLKFEPAAFCSSPEKCGVALPVRVIATVPESLAKEIMSAGDCVFPAFGEYIDCDIAPNMIFEAMPHYPIALRNNGVDGVVWVSALVDQYGIVRDVKVARTSGNETLDQSALESASKCRYEPAIKGGKPIAMWVTYKVEFRVER